MSDETKTCYMDGIDWQVHVGHDTAGAKVFPSAESCKRENPCIEEGGCGVVKVEVRLIEWVENQDLKFEGLSDDRVKTLQRENQPKGG